MIDFDYLYKGICRLTNAHKAGTMVGHLGAGVVAGYFFGEDQSDLADEIHKGVEGELDRVIAGEESFWFNAKTAGVTPTELFKPFPKELARQDAVRFIVVALRKNVATLRQSGHNIIFASIALRALHDHEEYVTPQIITGIRKLIEDFDNAPPGRGFFGKENSWLIGNQVNLTADTDFPRYESIQQMVNVTIAELIRTAAIKKQGFGRLWQIINHAAALTELDRFGYKEVTQMAFPANHQHIRLWRSRPVVENDLGAVVTARHNPRDPVYWRGMLKRDEAGLTHRIQTLYGFHTIKRFLEDEGTRKQAEDAFLYLMA